jgi:hypothetical protein
MIVTISLIITTVYFFLATGIHIAQKEGVVALIVFLLATLNLVALITHLS